MRVVVGIPYEVLNPEPSVFRHSARNRPVTDSLRGQGSVTTHGWSPHSPGTLQMIRFTGCGARRLQSIQGRTIDTPCMTGNRHARPSRNNSLVMLAYLLVINISCQVAWEDQ